VAWYPSHAAAHIMELGGTGKAGAWEDEHLGVVHLKDCPLPG
jgi:hypothetical protein